MFRLQITFGGDELVYSLDLLASLLAVLVVALVITCVVAMFNRWGHVVCTIGAIVLGAIGLVASLTAMGLMWDAGSKGTYLPPVCGICLSIWTIVYYGWGAAMYPWDQVCPKVWWQREALRCGFFLATFWFICVMPPSIVIDRQSVLANIDTSFFFFIWSGIVMFGSCISFFAAPLITWKNGQLGRRLVEGEN